jgi:HAD superfamily hydrolase (TIGR01509 family)
MGHTNEPSLDQDSIRGVLFDLDGVIIDSEPLHETAMRQVFRKMELAVPESRFREFKGTSERDTFALVAHEYAEGRFTGTEIHEAKQKIYEKGLPEVSLIGGFTDYVELLRAHDIPAVVVTSATRYNCDMVLRSHGIASFFVDTISADDITHAKPDPEPYRAGSERLGLSPRQCLVIEDSERGSESALAARCRLAGLTTTLSEADLRTAGCEWIAADFHSLLRTMKWPS